jgi:hypothetical protein
LSTFEFNSIFTQLFTRNCPRGKKKASQTLQPDTLKAGEFEEGKEAKNVSVNFNNAVFISTGFFVLSHSTFASLSCRMLAS